MVSNRARAAAFVVAVVAVGGCAPSETPGPEQTGAANPPSEARGSTESRPRVVVLGDSLTAGLGLNADEAFPALLQRRLDTAGLKYHVVNAGVSGDTSAGGLSRLDWALDGDLRVLIVALRGNDALRGLPVVQLRHNLVALNERALARDI